MSDSQTETPEFREAADPDEAQAMQELCATTFGAKVRVSGHKRDPDHPFFGLWAGGDLLGIVKVDLDRDKAVLRRFAVAPGYRGRGLSRRLAERAEAYVRERGQTLIGLGTAPGMEGYFRKLGYEVGPWPRGPQDTVTQPTVDMRKVLAA